MIHHPDYTTLPNGTLTHINPQEYPYTDTYWGVDGHSSIEDQVFNCDGFVNEAGETKAAFLLKFCVGDSLLEIGCAPGAFMRLASQNGFDCLGIEPCEEHAVFVREHSGCEVVTTMLEDFETERRFSTIVAADVLEHSLNPVGFVEKCRSLLVPKGRIIFMLPALYDDGLYRPQDLMPEHVNLFSQRHLREWLKPVIFDRWMVGHEVVVLE